MSEGTPHKRVLPARERSDSTAKRQATSPITPSATESEPRVKRKYTKRASLIKPTTPSSSTPSRPTPFEDALPTRLQNSRPLPTVPQKQPENLSNGEYQSIGESAILAASLHRSRMQWLCDGVFERYWVKPTKRKRVTEQPPGNPDVKTMSKLGNATMTIEPHVFEVTFYTVKEPLANQPPYSRHPNQHTVKQAQPPITPHLPPPTYQPQPPNPPVRPAPSAPSAPAVSQSTNTPVKTEASTASNAPRPTPISTPTASASVPAAPTPAVSNQPKIHAPTQSVAPISASHASSRPPGNDPVIQLLAARAASDNRLKELMKVVALSQATPEQLKEFQGHIDELHTIIKQQAAQKSEPAKTTSASTPLAGRPSALHGGPSRPHPGPPSSMGGPMQMTPPSYAGFKPPPRAEPFIKHIIIEFHSMVSPTQGASADRWLFPNHAVLDLRPGGMDMIASFFVVRKGEDILKRQNSDPSGDDSATSIYNPDVEYYQPVTISIKATAHKTIEAIARAAQPLTECQNHMKNVMEKKTRAPKEYLVHRLPREKALNEVTSADFVDSAIELSNDEDDELRDVYVI